MLIGLTGKAGAGKDSAAKIIRQLREDVFTLAFADPIREMAKIAFLLEDSHFEPDRKNEPLPEWNNVTPRRIMQLIGTEAGRALDPDIWVKNTFRSIDRISGGDVPLIVITDVRFDNEANAIRDRGGVVWEIRRDDVLPVELHCSENGVSDNLVDAIIHNDGTLEVLSAKVGGLLVDMECSGGWEEADACLA